MDEKIKRLNAIAVASRLTNNTGTIIIQKGRRMGKTCGMIEITYVDPK